MRLEPGDPAELDSGFEVLLQSFDRVRRIPAVAAAAVGCESPLDGLWGSWMMRISTT